MAGDEPQETGQLHGDDRVCLERRGKARLEGENQVRKRQPALTLSGGKGKRKGTNGSLIKQPINSLNQS